MIGDLFAAMELQVSADKYKDGKVTCSSYPGHFGCSCCPCVEGPGESPARDAGADRCAASGYVDWTLDVCGAGLSRSGYLGGAGVHARRCCARGPADANLAVIDRGARCYGRALVRFLSCDHWACRGQDLRAPVYRRLFVCTANGQLVVPACVRNDLALARRNVPGI